MKSTRLNLAHRFAVLAAAVLAMFALSVGTVRAASSPRAFETPEAAMNAFGDALAPSNEDGLKAILGSNFRDLIPPRGEEARYRFLEAWAKSHSIQADGDTRAHIAVGPDGWT